ncbi:MAG: restriction endonuclease subunit R, partial [bacterium]
GKNSIIKLLETLNVYGIKADYLNKFLEAIRKEEVEFETIEIPIIPKHKDKWENLYTLAPKESKKFEEEKILKLDIDNRINYKIDLLPKVSIYLAKDRKEEGIETKETKPKGKEHKFSEDIINILDWQRIHQEILEFKIQRKYWNLIFEEDTLKMILLDGKYIIFSFTEIFEVKNRQDVKLLEDIAILVIKKYIDLFYRKNAKYFETENLRYVKVKQLPLPFISGERHSYVLQINKNKKELINKIKELANDLEKLLREDSETLPRIYFDGSLYLPILIQNDKIDKISPVGLVESEKKFIEGLKKYLEKNKNKLKFEIYLLRNYPFSGVGFQLKWTNFYPDFIMWIKEGEKQTIVFIDPKGLEHSKGLDDEKIVFAQNRKNTGIITIKDIEEKLGNKIRLEFFILSATSYDKLIKGMVSPPTKEEYINNHVLFLDDEDWPERLISNLISKNSA